MTTGTFGESLKRERELRGVTLEEISAATRIATRFLKAIETEQWDQLPGGVFNRGFVRAMARFLGLDEENTVAEYVLAVGDRPGVPVWTGSPPVVTTQRPWLAWFAAVVVILALVAGGWFGTRLLLAKRAARKAGAAATAASAAIGGEPSSPAPDPSALATTGTAAAAGNPAAVNPVAATADSTAAAAPSSPPADQLQLKIEVAKRTKVTVVTDQDMVFDGTMKTGENHFFSASDHIQVSAKDGGAVRLVLNGKSLAAIGPSGKSGKVTLTRDALKGLAGGAN